VAGGAGPVGGEPVGGDDKPHAGNERLLAGRAVGVFVLPHPAGEVAGVDVPEPGGLADPSGPKQGVGARVARIGHLVVLVEGGDVPGDVGRDRN